jgi:ATP-binding cassette, subfamily B (MDR/TAP), member 1
MYHLLVPQYSSACETASHLIRLASLPIRASHEHYGRLQDFYSLPIRFDHVYFKYPTRRNTLVLRDLCLDIQPNKCTAIVGPSDCGKSTVASLLLKLYSVCPGSCGESGGTITLGD